MQESALVEAQVRTLQDQNAELQAEVARLHECLEVHTWQA